MLPRVEGRAGFAARFRLALQAAGLSRGRAASLLAVDKSLVGRWASGSVTPLEHNLAKITALVADRVPGFTMIDWRLDPDAFAARLGLDPTTARPAFSVDHAAPPFPLPLVEASRLETERRRGAYEGFWRSSRPSVLMSGRVLRDHGMIRTGAHGMLDVRMGGAGLIFQGCALVSEGNFFATLHDQAGCTPLFLIFRGVPLPKATSLDGLLLFASLDAARTPAAVPILLERIGELSGDPDADDRTCETLCQDQTLAPDGSVPRSLLAHLVRDIGPAAAAGGGDLFLTASAAANLSRGISPSGELQG